MTRIVYSLGLLSERVVEVKVGQHREYISLEFKDKGQIFDAIKYALISKDAFISNERLTEDLHHLIWKHV